MTNAEVFRSFANRHAAKGGSVRVEETLYGVVLYSYSTPIAFFPDAHEIPTFTLRKFSVTTSKQQNQARAVFGTTRNLTPENFVAEAKTYGADFGFAR